ncbi:MAG TPA: murein biosynthesis integral membrane protein MurJ [Candidatus Limnocylindria bacterium]|nr:murein biosynthesis integral membrane protein MurJ [Candidatus Limnocylindria bacterium]
MSRMLKSSGSVGAATLISRVLGFARESVYAAFMGDSAVASAFLYALGIPNLFRRLLGEGALTAAFIPIFKQKEVNEGEESMWHGANAVLSALIVVSAGLVMLAMLGLALAVTFVPMAANKELILRLLFVMFPYVGLVCIAAVFIGMLNARGHYFLPAIGATVLNVVMIGSVWLLAPRFGRDLEHQVFGLAVGLVLAGLLQAAFQLPALRREGFRWRWVTPWRDPTVRQVIQKMAPATIGVAAYQINVLLTQTFALNVDQHIVASFNYAVRLMELPQGVVGISLATYLLTELSHLSAEKKFPEFRAALGEGLRQVLFINGLACVLLVTLATPIMRLLFEHGKFTSASTARASFALIFLAPGLVAYSMNNILARAFYALGDTRTPMRISLVSLAINLVLAVPLILLLRQGGMGLANTISAATNSALLLYALKRALPKFGLREFLPNVTAVVGAATLAGLTAWGAHALWERWVGHAGLAGRSGAVFVPMALAGAVYLALALWLKLPQAYELLGLLRGRFQKGAAVPPPAVPPEP